MNKYPAPRVFHSSTARTVSSRQLAAVPKKTAKNNRLSTTTLIDCMAAIPCGVGRRANAFITKAENAKNTPPIKPEPSAETNVKTKMARSIIAGRINSEYISPVVSIDAGDEP
jgi:hypothetical protein